MKFYCLVIVGLSVVFFAHAQKIEPALMHSLMKDIPRADDYKEKIKKQIVSLNIGKTAVDSYLQTSLADLQRELEQQKTIAVKTSEQLEKQTQLTKIQEEKMLLDQQRLKLAEDEKSLQHMEYLKTQSELEAQQNKVAENQKLLALSQKEKELQSAQLALQTRMIQSKDLQRNLFIALGIILVAFCLFIFRNFRKQKQSNEVIRREQLRSESLLSEIQVKNKAITDNINYAQRIQSAILPDIKMIYKALEQSFILFLPKDIVSGDFYAFAEKNDRVLIVAGDCTGHGVSGAFMSMIASSLLNQIINEKDIAQPALILNHLNIAVIDALKQSENESSDGMDIAICSFDLSGKKVEYAGANRPLWLVRDNKAEVYKPDKYPIGGLQQARMRTYTNYELELQADDTVYIFTDGYADQFGGNHGKKLMTAHFKEKILSLQHLSMQDQHKHLLDYFEKWKGGHEQVDDVLVIGIRV